MKPELEKRIRQELIAQHPEMEGNEEKLKIWIDYFDWLWTDEWISYTEYLYPFHLHGMKEKALTFEEWQEARKKINDSK